MEAKIEQIIKPAAKVSGAVSLPGDKSISHRALMLGALCDGTVRVENLAPGRDVQSTATCLRALGVDVRKNAKTTTVRGVGLQGLQAPKNVLNAGNSGTTMRLLTGILAGQSFSSGITGDESLRKRDMRRIIDPLSRMGAKINSKDGFAPLSITGGNLRGIRYEIPVASAQVKSCLLLAGLQAEGSTTVIEPAATRDHTERMLQYFGVAVHGQGGSITLQGGSQPTARDLSIPGDISSAAFFTAAALLLPNSDLLIKDVGTNPTRVQLLETLSRMGARIELMQPRETNLELRADLRVRSAPLKGIEIRGGEVPLLIDEIPILAVLASQAQGTTLLRDAVELRKKESDRIKTVVTNLRKMGAKVDELPDGMKIAGPAKLRGARLDSFGDHRVAMAFSIAGLTAEGETVIEGAEWADISFPGFYETLKSISS